MLQVHRPTVASLMGMGNDMAAATAPQQAATPPLVPESSETDEAEAVHTEEALLPEPQLPSSHILMRLSLHLQRMEVRQMTGKGTASLSVDGCCTVSRLLGRAAVLV